MNKVNCLAIPTCNRSETLQRTLHSYLDNFRSFGRNPEIVVADDSRNPEAREKNRVVLGALRREFSASIYYAGLEEKLLFLKRLVSFGDVPPEVLKFALFDSERTSLVPYGANRNCLLLHSAGRSFISVDDDTACTLLELRDQKPGFRAVEFEPISESHPCDVYLHEDREQLLGSLEPAPMDFLGAHETALGRTVCELTGLPDPRTVRLTFNGVVGDSGWPSSSIYYLLTGASFSRFAASNDIYRRNLKTREAIRAVGQASVGTFVNPPGMFTGFDHSNYLPPFVPIGRGEDVMYWTVTARCLPSATCCYLPQILLHSPPSPRPAKGGGDQGPRFDFFMLLMAALRVFPPDQLVDGTDSLAAHLIEKGSLSDNSFIDYARELIRLESTATLDFLSRQASRCRTTSSECAAQLERIVKEGSNWLRSDVDVLPADLASKRPATEALGLTQRLFLRYGELLRFWPCIRKNVLTLALSGVRPGRPVA